MGLRPLKVAERIGRSSAPCTLAAKAAPLVFAGLLALFRPLAFGARLTVALGLARFAFAVAVRTGLVRRGCRRPALETTMTLTMREAHRHADRILELVRSGVQQQGNDPVAQSWSRCLNEYRLDPARPCEPSFVARVELEERRARRADVIACARYEMTTLYQQLADAEAAVVLTDTDGVIVHMVSSPEFAAEVGPLGLRVGGMWSETAAGTNGMGTCLAAGGPVSVRREDHFFTQFTQLTCSAVPVYDPSGEIAAVLDVKSTVAGRILATFAAQRVLAAHFLQGDVEQGWVSKAVVLEVDLALFAAVGD